MPFTNQACLVALPFQVICDSSFTYCQANGVRVSIGEIAQRYGAEGFGMSVYIQDPECNIVELKNAVI